MPGNADKHAPVLGILCCARRIHVPPWTFSSSFKIGAIVLFEHPNSSKIVFAKAHFYPFLTHFCSQNGPFSRYFGALEGPKKAQNGLKMASFQLSMHLERSTSLFENSLLTHLSPIFGPKTVRFPCFLRP